MKSTRTHRHYLLQMQLLLLFLLGAIFMVANRSAIIRIANDLLPALTMLGSLMAVVWLMRHTFHMAEAFWVRNGELAHGSTMPVMIFAPEL